MTTATPIFRAPNLTWPVLKPVGPEQEKPAIRINRASCLVGDRSMVHLPLRSPLVSRSHAILVVDDGEVYVRDLASRNRLFVNGSPVREISLRPADLLQIGPFRFRCVAGFTNRLEDDRRDALRNAGLTVAGSSQRHPLSGRTLLIGRREQCDLPLQSAAASDVHAVLFRRSGTHFIRDLNSRTGTWVNGRRIREAQIKDGDELRFATATFTYRLDHIPAAISDDANDSESATAEDSWLAADLWSSSSGALSVSRSVGAQTMDEGDPANKLGMIGDLPAPAEPLNLEAPAATADDLGFALDERVAPSETPALEGLVEIGLAMASELFPPEISLPARLTLGTNSIHRATPGHKGNGRH